MEVVFNSSIVFEKNYNAYYNPLKKIILNQGGSRSTKTYSIIQLLITLACQQETESIIDIVRKELSTLKVTVLLDFLEILKENDLYNEKNHNKTECTYKLGKVTFRFSGLDNPTKKRGAKRWLLFINEANELTLEDWRQLLIRTTGKIFIDYNPSEEMHWIYDFVLTRDDCEFIHSTYKDNPFLEDTLIKEIERTKDEDENFWNIYGLGEKGFSAVKIYKNWKVLTDEQWKAVEGKFNETTYGIDFAYNVPTALIETNEYDSDLYVRELVYETHLLNSDLIVKMKDVIQNKNKYVYADSAEPDKIKEISNAGYNVYPADKSVKDGIDFVKRKKIFIHCNSLNIIKEIKNYSWKVDKSGNILDEPVKANDHIMDAMRYSTYRKESEIKISFV